MLLAVGPSHSNAADSFSYDRLNRVLNRFVDERGLVNYAALKTDSGDLDAHIQRIAAQGPKTAPHLFSTRADSLAYWINAYNACVLSGVKEAYPVESVHDIKPFYNFFKQQTFRVDNQDLTLDQIEHDILRAQFGDPRMHAAINCAAISCPALNTSAFLASELDAQLDRAMQAMILSEKSVRLDRSEKTLYLSKIFDWFTSDFTYEKQHGVSNASVVDYIRLYMGDSDRRFLSTNPNIKVVFMDYDWSLNDQH